jgi:hypothetical protein
VRPPAFAPTVLWSSDSEPRPPDGPLGAGPIRPPRPSRHKRQRYGAEPRLEAKMIEIATIDFVGACARLVGASMLSFRYPYISHRCRRGPTPGCFLCIASRVRSAEADLRWLVACLSRLWKLSAQLPGPASICRRQRADCKPAHRRYVSDCPIGYPCIERVRCHRILTRVVEHQPGRLARFRFTGPPAHRRAPLRARLRRGHRHLASRAERAPRAACAAGGTCCSRLRAIGCSFPIVDNSLLRA